jgi:hypothetical protein
LGTIDLDAGASDRAIIIIIITTADARQHEQAEEYPSHHGPPWVTGSRRSSGID